MFVANHFHPQAFLRTKFAKFLCVFFFCCLLTFITLFFIKDRHLVITASLNFTMAVDIV